MTTKNTHGGAGRGQGRKSQYAEKLQPVTIHLTDHHKQTMKHIGGGKALREFLDLFDKFSDEEWTMYRITIAVK